MQIELKQGVTIKDAWGKETQVSVLLSDGRPVALIHSQERSDRYNDNAVHEEHVIQSIDMRKPGAKMWLDEDIQQISCPSRSGMRLNGDHDIEAILAAVKFNADEEAGFYFVKFGDQGASLPADASDGYLTGVKRASKQYSRIVRSGKLTGKPRSY